MGDSEILMVPHDRIGAVIGKGGETKQEIERATQTRLSIDSAEGEVGVERCGDAVKYLKAISIVKAIARGFSPERALRLLGDNAVFELIELPELLGKNESEMRSKRGRVIGEHGKARERIERDTGANISVYGKTIGIIGNAEEVEKAKGAVMRLLRGAGHDRVFRSLEREPSQVFEL